VWQHRLERSPFLALLAGARLTRLPEISLRAAEERATFMKAQLERVQTLDHTELTYHEQLIARTLEWDLARAAEEVETWWYFFPVTPFSSPLSDALQILSSIPLNTTERLEDFEHIAQHLPNLLDDMYARLEAQFQRGIVLPQAELEIVIPYLSNFLQPPEKSPFLVRPESINEAVKDAGATLRVRIDRLIEAELNPRIEKLIGWLKGDYARSAPDRVGLYQYPGGLDAYQHLIRKHLTLDLDPQQVHALGLEAVEAVMAQMAEVRAQLGYSGSAADYRDVLKREPYFYAKTPEEVGERLMGYVTRLTPRIPEYFSALPKAPFSVKRLAPEFEGSVTFGYYDLPNQFDPVGYYVYNGSDLTNRPLIYAAGLIYHELVPGHHFQLVRQMESEHIPLVSRYAFHTAYVEGWAEYAAELAGEMGLYVEPLDWYGRLLMHLFTAVRIVVDSGMNALGWTREQASAYMRERIIESETQISTETLRYAVDIPGQALTYKMGHRKFQELRAREQAKLGAAFDIRHFHESVLGYGSMPFPVLEWHLDHVPAE